MKWVMVLNNAHKFGFHTVTVSKYFKHGGYALLDVLRPNSDECNRWTYSEELNSMKGFGFRVPQCVPFLD